MNNLHSTFHTNLFSEHTISWKQLQRHVCMSHVCICQDWQKTSNSEAETQFKASLPHEPFMKLSIYPQALGASPRAPHTTDMHPTAELLAWFLFYFSF